ncbi:thylakoid lumenal 17.9 kDa protein, chloroplastic isoform X1 [Typha latifolia]|uniref:thylakoid lumenal 17.9 kDa protein, chloroplastic isoform X1 n=1 Tax=Typha latifolia TaxID=4733 RepID=UPI003C2CF55A
MSLAKILSSSPCPSILTSKNQTPTASFAFKGTLLSSLAPLAVAVALASPFPSQAIPFPNSQSSLLPPTTPFSQSQNLQLGLDNGKIRPCPSTNPGCVSTNPRSSSFASPWIIPETSAENAIQNLRDAIQKTQRNVEIKVDEKTPNGHYLQAEVDGGFGRDIMEFLVKRDFVAYRSMATKVTYVYPFTTALGDSKGQKERVNKIMEELGWYAPDFESMDS